MENEILYFSFESSYDTNNTNKESNENRVECKDELIQHLKKLFVRETLLAKKFGCIVLKKVNKRFNSHKIKCNS